jgi:hypothetical protein
VSEAEPKPPPSPPGARPIEAVGTAVAALVVVSAIGWLLARVRKHAREALQEARDAETVARAWE